MKLEDLRKKIDLIDEKILQLLAERMLLVTETKTLKLNSGLKIEDKMRENEIRLKVSALSKKLNLSEAFTGKIFKAIFAESKELQKKI